MTEKKTSVEARVKSAFTDPSDPFQAPLNISKLNVQPNIIGTSCAAPGNGVRVRIEYSIPVTMPFLGTVIGSQGMKMSVSVENAILSPVCP